MAVFKRVTIVGLGLIGGSLGMALRRRRLAREVVGLSRASSTLRRARARGAIDWGTTDEARAVRETDLAILATPVETIIPMARRLARWMPSGSVLTDVGSVKGPLVRTLERTMPRFVAFIGGHPLAGSERRGIEAARADLFDGSVCVLTRTARTDPAALAAVKRCWTPLVRRVLVMTPQQHDVLLAATSHLPHLIAWSLAFSAPRHGQAVAPPSFLEMTRIVESDPELWDDILLGNRRALLAAIDRFDGELRRLRSLIARGRSAALKQRLAAARARRHALIKHHKSVSESVSE